MPSKMYLQQKVISPTAVEIEDYIAAIGAKYPIMGEEQVWAA